MPSSPPRLALLHTHFIDEFERPESQGRLLASVWRILNLDPVGLGREIDAGMRDGVLAVQILPRAFDLERLDEESPLEIARLEGAHLAVHHPLHGVHDARRAERRLCIKRLNPRRFLRRRCSRKAVDQFPCRHAGNLHLDHRIEHFSPAAAFW